MRLNIMVPKDLTEEQRPLYNDMKSGIEMNFKGFEAVREDGALIGPWNPWLTFPKIGGPMWELVKALTLSPTLPRAVREIAILVIGAKFHSAYQLYSHLIMAELRGLDKNMLDSIVAGQRPSTLTAEESLAYDMALSLVNGGVLPDSLYKQSVASFNEEGAAELIYLIGLYCMVSVTLNGFDVPVPE